MLKIIANSTALQRSRQVFYHIEGGTPFVIEGYSIYNVSLKNGGIGGRLNRNQYIVGFQSIGEYTAPPIIGSETIIATDALGDTAELEINTLTAIGLLADVIKREMNLEDDQVFIYNQEFIIPPDDRLYISVRTASVKPFANNNEYVVNGNDLDSVQFSNFSSLVDINVMSKSEEALTRKEEVILALNSDYSFEQQDTNLIYIPKIPTQFVDIPDIEGGSRLFRFVITVNIHYSERKTSSTKCFDNFNGVRIGLESGQQFILGISEGE